MRGDVLILVVFAVYRVATDLAWMDGPFDAYAKVRGRVMTKYGKDDWRSNGITCPICLSFWLSLPAALLLGIYGAYDAWLWPLYWLGLAGAVALLIRVRS